MLNVFILLVVGCRSDSDSSDLSADTSTDPPVTWTAERCGYDDPGFEGTPTTSQDRPVVPGCPVVAEEGWHLFDGGAPNPEMVICQSAWTWDEAGAAGVLAALDIPDDLGPSVEFLGACEEVNDGEPIWSEFSQYWVESGATQSPSYSEGNVWWFTDQDGSLRSAILSSARGGVNCGQRAVNTRIVFGEPLFTPDARLFACPPP